MGKGNFHAIFDAVTFDSFQRNIGKGNVTRKIQEFMQSFNAQYSQDIDGINKEILQIEINNLNNMKIKIETELLSKRATLERIEKIASENEQKQLEKERLQIESAHKCLKCTKILTDEHKTYKFNLGVVCKGCYLGASAADFKKWKGD